jgi:O-antigen/teichoic acid export membrane protein
MRSLIVRLRKVLAQRHNVRAHFWQTCANYTQQISGLVLGVLLARLLTPADFGEFAYAAAVVGLFLLPASWSLAPQVVSEAHENSHIVDDALWVSWRIIFARAALAVSACVFLGFSRNPASGFLGMLIAIPLVGGELVAILRASLEGAGVFKVNLYDALLATFTTTAIGLPAAWLGAGVWSLAAPVIPLFLIQVVLFTRCTGRKLKPQRPKSDRRYFRSGSALWIASLGEGILFKADKFLLGNLSSLTAVGDYNRAFNYAPLSARALNSLLTNPTVAALVRAGDNTGRRRLLTKSAGLLLAGGILNWILLWWFSAPVVPALFGPQWTSAIPVFEAMAPMSLAMSFAYLPTALALASRNYTTLAAARVVSLTAFLCAALWLGPLMTAVKMAWLLQCALGLQGILLIAGQSFRSRQVS